MNEIEIRVKVSGTTEAVAELKAVNDAAREMGSSSSGTGDVSKGLDDIGRSAERGTAALGLFRDGNGDLRNSLGQVATDAEKSAAGLDDAGKKADSAGNAANSGGNGFAFLHSKVFLLTSAALALGPALAAVPAVLGAASLGAGTMALAFGGVIGALKDYAAQSAGSSAAGASSAATAFSNAVAIRNAEQAITDAKRQAAQQAQQSAAAIVAAQQSVGDAERQAAQQAQQSADSVIAAQQRLAQTQQSLAQAQQTLTLAERDGVNVLKDLNLASEDAANSVADAQNSVADAQAAYEAANNNSLLTAQQKKEALQALIDAQQHLQDAQQKATEAQQAANDANSKGVEGSTAVVSAQQSVQTAMQNVADAQHSLVVTQQTAANQQISSNESVAKAEQGLATAKQQAAQQAQASAEQVSKAVQALSDMETQQALAAQSAGGAQNKFAQDMAKLSQPARDLVNQILGMKDGFHELSVTAQTATLPGFTQMLKDLPGLLPTINGGIRDMGTAISNTAVGFGNLMKSPAFQGQLQSVLKDAADLATQLGNGLLGMVSGITQAAASAGPVVAGIGNGLKTLMSAGIPDLLNNMMTNASGIGQAFQGILTLVSNLAGPLGTVSGAFVSALAPAIQVLASPSVQRSLQSIATSIAQILTVLSPVITMLAQGLAGALQIVAPLLQLLAKFIQDNATWLVPLAKAVTIATIAWWGFNAALAANPIILVATAIASLVLGLIYCYERFQWFRDFVNAWWPELLAPFTGGVSEIIGHWNVVKNFFAVDIPHFFDVLLQFVKNWWPELLEPFTGGASEIIGHWGSIEDFFAKAPGRLASTGAHMWDWIWSEFKGPINDVIRAWDSLHFTMPSFDTHIPGIGVIGGFSVGVPQISTFAVGGPLPGGLTAAIGDGGWEPLRLPNGTTVIPHANAQAALASGAGGGSGGASAIQVEWVGGAAGDEFLTWLRKNIRIRGGNASNSVQRVLGQTS